jgi:hypothetical protein
MLTILGHLAGHRWACRAAEHRRAEPAQGERAPRVTKKAGQHPTAQDGRMKRKGYVRHQVLVLPFLGKTTRRVGIKDEGQIDVRSTSLFCSEIRSVGGTQKYESLIHTDIYVESVPRMFGHPKMDPIRATLNINN